VELAEQQHAAMGEDLGMGPGRLAAVADTGPLIHLAEVDCLPLLSIFEVRNVPEGVWRAADRPATIRQDGPNHQGSSGASPARALVGQQPIRDTNHRRAGNRGIGNSAGE
jgi:hypothetical protein